MKKEDIKCSFCDKEKKDTLVLIAGIRGHICELCIEQAERIVQEELSESAPKSKSITKLSRPKEITDFLDDYVIGQTEAKRAVAVSVYNHYKRLLNVDEKNDDVEIEKSNMILVGGTGTGKTLLARTIAKLLNVPFCIADATVLTEAGYVGEDIESILSRLLQAANYNTKDAERGIVYIDEIDKIARKNDNPSITRDVSGEGVQQGLLKLLEGSVVHVPPQGGRKHPEQKLVAIDTRNILFICGGAFDGIEKLIARRVQSHTIGYSADQKKSAVDEENLVQYVASHDLRKFGLIPELIGRLPIVVHLNPLDKEALKRILTEPKNALMKQYGKLFELDKVVLKIEDNVLDYIVEKAVEFKLGARGLRSLCEVVLMDAMYDLPTMKESTITITLPYAHEKMGKVSVNKLKVA